MLRDQKLDIFLIVGRLSTCGNRESAYKYLELNKEKILITVLSSAAGKVFEMVCMILFSTNYPVFPLPLVSTLAIYGSTFGWVMQTFVLGRF